MRGKGEGSIFLDKTRNLWTTHIELPPDPTTGKRRRKTIRRKDKGDLLNARTQLLADLNKAGDLPTSSPTLEQWAHTWTTRILPARRLKPRTIDGYRRYVRNYITPTIGRYRLDQLTPDHVRRVHDHILNQGLSSTTALQAHRILAKCLTDAMRESKVTRNVATLVDAPSKAVTTQRALNVDQARTLLKYVGRRMDEGDMTYARWVLPVLTGMRQGEQLGLTREMVDLDTGTITVAWALQRLTWEHGCGPRTDTGWPCGKQRAGSCHSRTVTIPPGIEARHVIDGLWMLRPKSRKGWREVPMAPQLWDVMRRYIEKQNPHELMFTRGDGKPHDPARDHHAWKALLTDAGLPEVTLHSARHAAATLLRSLGAPDDIRMKVLGHSSATVTAGYTHLTTEDARAWMDKFGGLLLEA